MSPPVRESLARSYRDTVRASDSFLEQLQEDLIEDDPAYIVHSDHGESFGEHDNYGHHHRELYDENVHVPYVVYNAGVSDTIDAPVSLSAIYETALAIAQNGTFDPAAHTEPYAISTSECGTNRAVRGSQYKYIDHDGEQLLFDIESDPSERVDLSEVYPDVAQKLKRWLDRFGNHVSETDRVHRATSAAVAFEQI